MKTVTKRGGRTWVLQAYLAVSPRHPTWADVTLNAIKGWEKYHRWEGGKLRRDPRLHPDTSGWNFVSAEAAQAVLAELLQYPQEYFLRVIERQTILTEVAIAGYDIENGTVVRETDGSKPIFMGEEVEGCIDGMPSHLDG